jgi:hypothetical protein
MTINERLLLAQGCPDPTGPKWSAYWGAPAAHTRAREMVGAAESDPDRHSGEHHERNFITFTKAVRSFSRDTAFDPRKRGLRASAAARVTAGVGSAAVFGR